MSEDNAAENQAPAKPKRKGGSSFFVAMLPLLVLFAAAAGLYWNTAAGGADAYRYWEYFIPVVALISLFSGWGQSYLAGEIRIWYVIRQLLHWGGLVAVLYLLNTHGVRAALGDQQYTSVVVYLLAFTTLLAAIHMDLKLVFFAAFLVFCGSLLAVPEGNPAVAFIGEQVGVADAASKPVTVSNGVAVAGFIASLFILMMMRGALISKRVRAKRKEG